MVLCGKFPINCLLILCLLPLMLPAGPIKPTELAIVLGLNQFTVLNACLFFIGYSFDFTPKVLIQGHWQGYEWSPISGKLVKFRTNYCFLLWSSFVIIDFLVLTNRRLGPNNLISISLTILYIKFYNVEFLYLDQDSSKYFGSTFLAFCIRI